MEDKHSGHAHAQTTVWVKQTLRVVKTSVATSGRHYAAIRSQYLSLITQNLQQTTSLPSTTKADSSEPLFVS